MCSGPAWFCFLHLSITRKPPSGRQKFEQWHEGAQSPWDQVIIAGAIAKAPETESTESIYNVREPFLALFAVYVLPGSCLAAVTLQTQGFNKRTCVHSGDNMQGLEVTVSKAVQLWGGAHKYVQLVP